MAKTPRPKSRELSVHSRAARRGASPPPNKLASKPAVEESEYKPWLHSAQSAGITKKTKAKSLSRQQRLRQQRGIHRADANTAKLEQKVADSKHREKKVKARRIDWDELNNKVAPQSRSDMTKTNGGSENTHAERMEDVDVIPSPPPAPLRTADASGDEPAMTTTAATAERGGPLARVEPVGEDEDEIT